MSNKRGMALVLACLVMGVLGAFGSAMMAQTMTEHRVVNRHSDLAVAFQLAESGADHALANLAVGQEDNLDEIALAGGSYWAEIETLDSSHFQITSHGMVGDTQRDIEMVVSIIESYPFSFGVFGETSVTLKSASTTDSYNSLDGDYDPATAGDEGHIATNNTAAASIVVPRNSTINGQLTVGPGMADPSSAVSLTQPVTITADPDVVSADEELDLPALDVSGLDCSSSLSLPKNGTHTFTEEGSPYCFGSISADIGSRIAVSGDVVVYSGTVNFDKNFEVNTGGDPTQFVLGVYGNSDVVIDKDGTFVGALYAPGLKVHFKKNVTIYGGLAADDVEVDKQLTLHYDEALRDMPFGGAYGVSVESWREL